MCVYMCVCTCVRARVYGTSQHSWFLLWVYARTHIWNVSKHQKTDTTVDSMIPGEVDSRYSFFSVVLGLDSPEPRASIYASIRTNRGGLVSRNSTHFSPALSVPPKLYSHDFYINYYKLYHRDRQIWWLLNTQRKGVGGGDWSRFRRLSRSILLSSLEYVYPTLCTSILAR